MLSEENEKAVLKSLERNYSSFSRVLGVFTHGDGRAQLPIRYGNTGHGNVSVFLTQQVRHIPVNGNGEYSIHQESGASYAELLGMRRFSTFPQLDGQWTENCCPHFAEVGNVDYLKESKRFLGLDSTAPSKQPTGNARSHSENWPCRFSIKAVPS